MAFSLHPSLEKKDFICDLCYRYNGGNINEK